MRVNFEEQGQYPKALYSFSVSIQEESIKVRVGD